MMTSPAQDREDRMMKGLVVRVLVVVALLACATAPAFAGSDERKGTGGALELRLPVGPRGTALGSSVVSDAYGIDALFWNPAGLATIERTEAMFTHTRYFADMNLNYAAVGTHLGFGTLALNAKVLRTGDVIVTTEDAPDGTGEILDPTFSVFGVSFARQFTDRVMFGLTTNFITEQVRNAKANGMSFDFGVQYLTGFHGMRFGMAMKNFGPSMSYSGDDFDVNTQIPGTDPTASNRTLAFTSAEFEQPSYFTLSASYDLMKDANQRLVALGSFQNNNFIGDNFSGGAEWTYKSTFALRGSYYGSITNPIDATTGDTQTKFKSGDDLYSGFAFGVGAQVKTGDTRLGVDMAWKTVRNFFDDTIEVGLRLMF
jgi:hypothetical protein